MQHETRFTIGGREIGRGRPLFVIAEIGLNHGGSLEQALAMVDIAAAAGVSAVKLQTLEAEALVAPGCPAPAHVSARSLTDFFSRFELDEAAHARVAARAREHGLAFISTPFSLEAVSLLERVGVDAFKIASGDLTWDALIERAARTRTPLIVSTGMATFDEIAHAVTAARLAGARDLALLHCVSAYPVPRGSENLQAIDTLHRSFHVPVGLSDHGADACAVPIAVALGACIYERHFVLPGDREAIDVPVSGDPAQFSAIVADAARARLSLGDGDLVCAPAEAPNRVPSRRALYTRTALSAGTVLEPHHLIALRPGSGIEPNRLDAIVGRVLLEDLPSGVAIAEPHLIRARERRSA